MEEILARTDRATIRKLYTVEEYTSILELLTMVALTTHRLLKVRLPSSLLFSDAFAYALLICFLF